MRLAGQIKGGFYPAPIQAVDFVMRYVKPPARGNFAILDPCCGDGMAIKRIAHTLKCRDKSIYACELSPDLGIAAEGNLGKFARLIQPCDFMSVGVSRSSISFAWVNPPFDSALTQCSSAKRMEFLFLNAVSPLLCDGGVLALVAPEAAIENYAMQRALVSKFDDLSIVKFPEPYRKFNEVVVLGSKRKHDTDWFTREWSRSCSLSPIIGQYRLPESSGPKTFRKERMSEEEMLSAIERSPAMALLREPSEKQLARPPLALGSGHIALLVASGQLDGLIRPDGEPPHVVRGTSKKVEYVDSECESDDGKKRVTTIKQRIVISVRAIDGNGEIKSFTDQQEGECELGSIVEERKRHDTEDDEADSAS